MRSILPLVALVLLVPAAFAGADRSVTAPAPVLAIAFDGSRIAYVSGRSATDCDRVRLWNFAPPGVTRLGRGTHCAQTSTGTKITTVAVAGRRALWLHVTGGNIREWSLWTATGHLPAPRRLRFARADADAAPPIVVGNGDTSRRGDLLPYAVGRTVAVLRVNGSRRFAWTAPTTVTALSAFGGELAVAVEGGDVFVLDASGQILRTQTFGSTADAVHLTDGALAIQRGRSIEVRTEAGAETVFSVAAGIRLADAEGDRIVLVGGGSVRVLDLRGGREPIVAAGSAATLELGRLAIASGRRVSVRLLR